MRMFCLAMVLLAPSWTFGQAAGEDNFEALSSRLKAGTIARIEILRMPDDVETRVNVTPEILRTHPSYKVIFNDDLNLIFAPLFSGTSFKRTSDPSDLRWGAVFYDGSGRELGSIFVDHFGETGYVNGDTGRYNSNLATRLRQIVRELR